jgi:hypothetical protein
MFCISCYKENNETKIIYHTKGSLENEYIDWAKEYLSNIDMYSLTPNYTYIFEICHPNDPHIVPEEFGAYLIGVRGHDITSIPLSESMVDNEAQRLKLQRPKWFKINLSDLLSNYIFHKNEGYIIRESIGLEIPLFKLKTPYYKYLKIIARGKSNNALNRGLEISKDHSTLERLHTFVQFAHPLIFNMEEQQRLSTLRETYKSLELAEDFKEKESLKTMYIIRGLPGSGKTTLAKQLLSLPNSKMFEADTFFINEDGKYLFNKEFLHQAHKGCQKDVLNALSNNVMNIIISNTSTTEKEVQPYLEMAKVFGYKVHSIVLENRHLNSSVHNVPEENLYNMKERFSIKL